MIEQIASPASGSAAQSVKAPSTANTNANPKANTPIKDPTVDTAAISPRLRFDAVSGVVVTEFLKSGTIQATLPSAAALAYLRAGLAPDGGPKAEGEAGAPPTEA